jgi:hypothetical protein
MGSVLYNVHGVHPVYTLYGVGSQGAGLIPCLPWLAGPHPTKH